MVKDRTSKNLYRKKGQNLKKNLYELLKKLK